MCLMLNTAANHSKHARDTTKAMLTGRSSQVVIGAHAKQSESHQISDASTLQGFRKTSTAGRNK